MESTSKAGRAYLSEPGRDATRLYTCNAVVLEGAALVEAIRILAEVEPAGRTLAPESPTGAPVFTDCGNCGSCDHAGYRCPCGCHNTQDWLVLRFGSTAALVGDAYTGFRGAIRESLSAALSAPDFEGYLAGVRQ